MLSSDFLGKRPQIDEPVKTPQESSRSSGGTKNQTIKSIIGEKRKRVSSEGPYISSQQQALHLRPTKHPKTGKFSDEFNVLQESWRPNSISHRDIEKAKIRAFIEEGIKSNGSETSLYITGLPGLGKTASVFEIMQQYSSNPRICTIYINALKLASTSTFYKEFLSQMTGKIWQNNEACKRLAVYFRSRTFGRNSAGSFGPTDTNLSTTTTQGRNASATPSDKTKSIESSLKKTKILIIDEIDYLMTKKQEILYNIFDWMHTKNSHLIVISIANTLDFPSKLFPKIQSRMGKNILVFKPYTSNEIASILNERLENSEKFSKDALVYVAKKVASFSSDIRRSLHIVRKALQLYIKVGDTSKPIDHTLINKVLEFEGKKPLIYYIEETSEIFRFLLIAVLVERVAKNSNMFEAETLYGRVNVLLRSATKEPITFAEFMVLVDRARDISLLRRVFDNLKRMKIEIATDPEEMAFALRNDEIFNKYNPVNMFNKTE